MQGKRIQMSASKLKDVCTIGAFKDQETEAADLELQIIRENGNENEILVARCYNHSVAYHGYQVFLGDSFKSYPSFVCGITCISEIHENSEVIRGPLLNREVIPPLNLYSKGIKMMTVMKKDSSLWKRHVEKK